MSDIDELRDLVMNEEETYDEPDVPLSQNNEGRIFGLTAGERMIMSIIVFLAVVVLSMAALLATNTIVLR